MTNPQTEMKMANTKIDKPQEDLYGKLFAGKKRIQSLEYNQSIASRAKRRNKFLTGFGSNLIRTARGGAPCTLWQMSVVGYGFKPIGPSPSLPTTDIHFFFHNLLFKLVALRNCRQVGVPKLKSIINFKAHLTLPL